MSGQVGRKIRLDIDLAVQRAPPSHCAWLSGGCFESVQECEDNLSIHASSIALYEVSYSPHSLLTDTASRLPSSHAPTCSLYLTTSFHITFYEGLHNHLHSTDLFCGHYQKIVVKYPFLFAAHLLLDKNTPSITHNCLLYRISMIQMLF